ncbi:unnamed protein product [Dibothriocephalus latus]|uniref:Uncharacterized protein n=1 Tax=Dibothriocephalus latus TaxID=60516 RepID=A0A3P7NNW8_DIBLA|nr:unnamed protein product [Dibothriocephalus latus]
MRGAKTGHAPVSDHVLIRTCLKVFLSSVPKMPHARRLDVAKLRQHSTTGALSTEIQSRLGMFRGIDIIDRSRLSRRALRLAGAYAKAHPCCLLACEKTHQVVAEV